MGKKANGCDKITLIKDIESLKAIIKQTEQTNPNSDTLSFDYHQLKEMEDDLMKINGNEMYVDIGKADTMAITINGIPQQTISKEYFTEYPKDLEKGTIIVKFGNNNRSVLKIGNLRIYTTNKFNSFQRKMMKKIFGIEIEKYEE